MSIKKKDITELNKLVSIISTLGTKYKPEMKQVIDLFQERKIHTKREAIKTITMLGSSGKKNNIKGLERIETHKENALSTDHPSVRFNQKRGIMQNYHIRGSVETKAKYCKIKSGTVQIL